MSEKKSFFDSVKNLIFVEEPSTEPKEESAPAPAPSRPQPVAPPSYQTQHVPTPSAQSVYPSVNNPVVSTPSDPKFRTMLEDLLSHNNLQGLDYFEFNKAVKANEKIPGLTEPLRYSTTFSILQASDPNLTKDHLVKTADHYIKILVDEEASFDREMEKVVAEKVVGLQNQAKQKTEAIQVKRDQMVALQQEIEAMQGEINQLNMDSQNEQTKINFQSQEFKSSVVGLRSEIERNKELINSYLA